MASRSQLRFAALLLLGVLTGLAGFSPEASSEAIVDVIWTATDGSGVPGSGSIEAASGDTLTAELRVTAGPEGVSVVGISLEFDTDGADELQLMSATETCTPPSCGGLMPITPGVGATQDSSAGMLGFVDNFEAATFGAGPVSSTFTLGTVTFQVTPNVATDGDDVFSGLFAVGVDGIFDNANQPVVAAFNDASVDAPEPGSLALASLALVGLALRLAGSRVR